MKTHKLSNHIILSGITVSMLFSPLMALPSGGKFTHGTSGTITSGNGHMQINGKETNSVIQWGGGFNIGQGESVNFGGNSKNYLNIAHGTSKSTIEGVLNAKGNNVFLINPNGVIITKTGTINANRFVASTSSLNENDYKNFFSKGASFSPVFKPNPKGGNVINMGGEINAASVVLQGNKVVSNAYADYGKNLGEHSKQISANEITLQGNEVYVDVSSINGNKLSKLNIKGGNGNSFKGSMYLNASGYYYNPNSFKVFDKYTNTNNNFKVYDYVGIGSDVDWWHFAKGWNENKEGFRDIASEYRLTNDIDFKASNGQNYANYCIDGYSCTNMIVGSDNSAFTKTFDGQGYTLKNINIDTTKLLGNNFKNYIGLFGKVQNATFKNINVDYMDGGINAISRYIGGFVGFGYQSDFYNISINNSGTYNTEGHFLSGFGGIYEGKVQDVIVNNSGFFKGYIINGFGGGIGEFSSIIVNNSGIFKSKDTFNGFAQGFGPAGDETMIKTRVNNIIVDNSGDFYAKYIVGLGNIRPGTYAENIIVNNSGDFYLTMMCGLSDIIYSDNFYINSRVELKNIIINNTGKFARSDSFDYSIMFHAFSNSIFDADISNIAINNKGKFLNPLIMFFAENSLGNQYENIHIYIDDDAKMYLKEFFNGDDERIVSNFNIYTHEDTVVDLTPNDKINIHTYNDSNKDEVYNKFKEQADTISKPILPIMPPPSKPSEDMNIPDVEKIKNETATLDQGDLISDDIWDYIINDIDKVHYNIDIRLLAKLLNEYSNISNKTEDEQIKFITTYLGVKENDARALLQSLSFLNAYKDHYHDIDKAKFTDETVKTNFANSFKNAGAKFTNFNDKKNKLYNELKDLNENIVSKGFNIEHLLDENQEELAKFIKAYNDYVVLIEKGLANENDPLFVSIKSTIIKLNTEAKTLYAQLLSYKDQLQDFKDNNKFEKVIIAGDFKTIPLLIAPDVNKPIDGGGEIEIPDKPIDPVEPPIDNKPDDSLAFEQSSTFNSIGNETLNEEEETEEIDETSLIQKSKTCIVSDNYKTMNPCVVGGL